MPVIADKNREEIVSLLQASLPAGRLLLLRLVAKESATRKIPLYLVGGFVRDLLLGVPGQDFDVVVEGDAIALANTLADKYGGRVTVHARFGTAKWSMRHSDLVKRLPAGLPDSLDFITARSETYTHPGALPSVCPSTLADDLDRRDFTINTLALRLDGKHFGELRDDFGSLEDLRGGTVRTLHPGSYNDDPTRILRAVRYEQRYGFRIAAPDLENIARARVLLAGLSADRVRHELNLILLEKQAVRSLDRLEELGVMKSIHPVLPWSKDLKKTFETALDLRPPAEWGPLPDTIRIPQRVALGFLLWFLRLTPAEIEALDTRLHFTAPLREALLSGVDLYRDIPGLKSVGPGDIYDRLVTVPPIAIFAVFLVTDTESREILSRYMTGWRHIKVRTTGDDLKRLGLAPGPVYQVILKGLRTAWLEGRIQSAGDEAALLEEYARKFSPR